MNIITIKIVKYIVFFFILLTAFILTQKHWFNYQIFNESKSYTELKTDTNVYYETKLDLIKTRDFMRYECLNQKRIGGLSKFVKNAPNPMYRLDGAWFICIDGQVNIRRQDCTVFSFGIHDDFSFDEEISRVYECRTFSFDPFHEAEFFRQFRANNPSLLNSVDIRVNKNWVFYRQEYILTIILIKF